MRQAGPLEKRFPFRVYASILTGALGLLALYATSLPSYLLFHTLVELLTIVVAGSIFLIVWNTRRFMTNGYLSFLGIAYLFVAAIDLIHTLTYTGMGVLPQFGSNAPTQLWIAARAMQSISLLVAPLFLARKARYGRTTFALAVVSSLLIASIFLWNVFPVCYIDGVGLTAFKKISEYAISLLLVAGWLLLLRNRARFEKGVFAWISVSVLLAVGAELAFTFYVSVYGLSNLIGHMLKLASFFALYKAIVETGLRKPYELLFRELKDSEQAFEAERDFAEGLVDTAQAVIVVLDMEGRIVRFNRYMEELSGYRLDEVQGKDWLTTFLPQRDHVRVRELLARGLANAPTRGNVNPIVTRSGEERQIEWSDSVRHDGMGSIVGLISIGTDVTKRLRAEVALRESEERYRAVVENANDLIQYVGRDGRFLLVNRTWLETLGYSEDDVPHLTVMDILREDQIARVKERIGEVAKGKALKHFETVFVTKRGVEIPVEGSGVGIFDGEEFLGSLGLFRDVTERKQYEEKLAHMARRDPLTGILNRYALEELLEREASRSARYDHSIGFLMIDVNRFKEINDRFGHGMGDKVLQTIAQVIQNNVRESDILVRYGGDEFLVILPETNGETDLVKERIRSEIAQRNKTNPLLEFPVTLAIGSVHWSSGSGQTVEEALAETDKLMYEDKRK